MVRNSTGVPVLVLTDVPADFVRIASSLGVTVTDQFGILTGYQVTALGTPGADYNNQQQPYQVTLPTNRGVSASRLNLTQEHFSRILHELTELGLIVVEGRKIHIPSVANLRKHEG